MYWWNRIFNEKGNVLIMENINFKPFPYLTTERLNLRQLNCEDEYEFYILKSDKEILKHLKAKAKTFDEAQEFMQKLNDGIANNEWIIWGITLKDMNKLIGTICLWNISADYSTAELGYELMPNYQGKGIMNEAVATVLKYGFEDMKLHSIEAVLNQNNSKSFKLLIMNNFLLKEPSCQGIASLDEKVVEMDIYSLTNPALESMNK